MNLKKAGYVLFILISFILSNVDLNARENIMFKSNFSDLKENWEVMDDPDAKKSPAKWLFGLAELSGIHGRNRTLGTAILAGEKVWRNYSVETSLHVVSPAGFLVGIICGYQGPTHFAVLGYNFDKGRFEFVTRTPQGFEVKAFYKVDFLFGVEVPLRLDYTGDRICFSANGRVIFDMSDDRYPNGQFGLGATRLERSKVLFGPVTVRSLDLSKLPGRDIQDLLCLRRGGRVVSAKDKRSFETLIDHILYLDKDSIGQGYDLSINHTRTLLPAEGVFAFPQDIPVEIHRIGFQLDRTDFPGEIEFFVSAQNQADAFQSLGKFQIKPEKNSFQEFTFDPVKATFLKVRLLSATSKKYLRIKEMIVKGFQQGSERIAGSPGATCDGTEGKPLFEDDFASGNVDRWEVWNTPDASGKKGRWQGILSEFSGTYHSLNHPATLLLTGQQNWTDYSVQTDLYAVQSGGNLSGLVFGFQDPETYYIVGYNFHKGRYEMGQRTPQGYEILAWAETNYPRRQWLPVRVDIVENRILFRCNNTIIFDMASDEKIAGRVGLGTSSISNGAINFKDFIVSTLDKNSLPERELQDLLASRRGAAVIYRESLPKSEKFGDMLDHPLFGKVSYANSYRLDLSKDSLPQEAVFCFPQGRIVEIHKLGFKLGRTNFPKVITFQVSDQTPKSGFSPLTEITLQQKSHSFQEFSVPPTRAKYLKIHLSQGSSAKEVEIQEMVVKGYFLERGIRQPGEESLGEIQIQEKEPNDTPGQAQSFPLNTYLGGTAARQDVDYYTLSLSNRPGNTLTLNMNNLGIIRPGYALSTQQGTLIDPIREEAVANTIRVIYQLSPDDYLLRIERPESYLTIVFDDSGSMSSSVDIVKRILGGYLDSLDEGLNMQLMKYEDEPHSLSDFTHDAVLLKQAMAKEVRGGGGTDTFKGLRAAVKSVAAKKGNRAVLAIFDVIDCSDKRCLQYYVDLWNAILDSGISFSTIGVQSGWASPTRYFGNSRQRILKEIAYSSNGQFYHSPTAEMVELSADRIFKQLTSPLAYRLKAEWTQTEKKPGFIEIEFDKGAEKKAQQNVELILDASNSMWGQIQGKAKIAIAKEVLTEIINGLPDEMNVGLRLYGHRYKLKDSRACRDTALVTPISAINKTQLVAAVKSISPRGKTPLVYSVLAGINDFKTLKGGTIVLISDGVESCGGDIDAIAPAVKAAGLDLQVNIVGFDIKGIEARKQLEAIAASTGGTYLDAKDSEQLLDSLEQTLRVEFVLMDNQGGIKARGVVGGEPVQILEGTYSLKLLLQPEALETDITITADVRKKLTLSKDAEKWTLVK